MFKNNLAAEIEALLFIAGDAVPVDKIAAALELTAEEAGDLLDEIQAGYAAENRGITLRRVAGGVQLCTKPEYSQLAGKLVEVKEAKLSNAALEVLSIIAFKQPVTRQEIEALRGVNSDKVLHGLIEKSLIQETGRRDTPGKPALYGTTEDFLYCFGLEKIDDLGSLIFQQQTLLE